MVGHSVGQNGTGQSLGKLVAFLCQDDSNVFEYIGELESRFDEVEAKVHSFVPEEGRFDRLRKEAGDLLASYPVPDYRPELFGVPIGVKDILHVRGLPTRAGSQLPTELFAGPEGFCVRRLRAAGALILGKTVCTEFSYFAPGPTRNPVDLAHTPGGSSSGSAAAVAAGLCPLAVGTQFIGSIVRPAAFCGVVGYKPSYERIESSGAMLLVPSLDHLGFLSSCVEGVERAASLVCSDWEPAQAERRPVLGIPRGPYLRRAASDGRTFLRNVCERLSRAGYEVCSVDAMPDFEGIELRHRAIVAGEAARVHAERYERFRDLYHPKTAQLIEEGRRISDSELQTAQSGCESLREELESLRQKSGIDLWISPAAPGVAPHGLESTGDPIMNLPWTHAGLPTLGIPAGNNSAGLPFGLQITAGWLQDERLLSWGRRLEQVPMAQLA